MSIKKFDKFNESLDSDNSHIKEIEDNLSKLKDLLSNDPNQLSQLSQLNDLILDIIKKIETKDLKIDIEEIKDILSDLYSYCHLKVSEPFIYGSSNKGDGIRWIKVEIDFLRLDLNKEEIGNSIDHLVNRFSNNITQIEFDGGYGNTHKFYSNSHLVLEYKKYRRSDIFLSKIKHITIYLKENKILEDITPIFKNPKSFPEEF